MMSLPLNFHFWYFIQILVLKIVHDFHFWYISWFANKLFTNFLHQFPENGMPMLPVITFIAAGLWQEPSLTPLAWCILQNVMNLSSRSNPNPNLNLMSLNGDVPVLKLLNHSKIHQSTISISVANCFLIIYLLFSYQYGPDTYLLQVKDSDFPARLREYLHVAKQHSAEFQDVKVRIWVCSFLLVTKIFSGKVALIFDENIYQIF